MYHLLAEQFLCRMPELLFIAAGTGQEEGQDGEKQQQSGTSQKLPPVGGVFCNCPPEGSGRNLLKYLKSY